ncbi:MAG TPA: translation initiation factor IF-2 [Firmicutes bacterium]|nr:translation initiation factor IF-2 [Bacillota bacterium]
MTVEEYAVDTNNSIDVVLKKCKELEIDVSSKDDFLEDDDIIILDNELNGEENLLSEELESKYDFEDRAEELIVNENIKTESPVKKIKLKKKDSTKDIENFKKEKKSIYKNKTKLQSNMNAENNVILYKEGMTVKDLAKVLGVADTDLVKKMFMMGLMININSSISFEDAEVICMEYKKELKKEASVDISNFEEYEIIDNEDDLVTRPPVVTIMGHVDHGKTSLLDYIRNTHVVSKEAGGITQAIGAYQVEINGNKITFIDTPGHAAFTEMRARGAKITDIVVIIVAADDGVMPQTKEAIDHAKSAKVPIIVAINKIDKTTANVDKIMSEMSEYGLTPEEWGGDTIFVKLSAHTGENVDLLLENIIALAEMEELKANPKRYAVGTVIESKLDKNKGVTASLLINNGTLRLGDPIVVGSTFGKVRTLKDCNGKDLTSAEPSMPVEITGLNEVPVAGDKFMAFESEKTARSVAEKRSVLEKEKKFTKKAVSLEDLFERIESGHKEINIVLKTDVKGSEEAVKNALEKINVEGVKVTVIRSGVGTITESDVVLASASNAIIIGFNVVPSSKTKEAAKNYNVDIRLYNIIYKLVEEIESAMKGMLDPEYEEVTTGEAEIRQIFKFSKVGNIAGVHVTSGVVKNNSECKLIRDGVIITTTKIKSLQREKDQVKEVKSGFDCGITLENYTDIKVGDTILTFEMREVK